MFVLHTSETINNYNKRLFVIYFFFDDSDFPNTNFTPLDEGDEDTAAPEEDDGEEEDNPAPIFPNVNPPPLPLPAPTVTALAVVVVAGALITTAFSFVFRTKLLYAIVSTSVSWGNNS